MLCLPPKAACNSFLNLGFIVSISNATAGAPYVAIVDYGMGNLRSVATAVQAAAKDSDLEVRITANPQEVLNAQRVVLPGQGAMADCVAELDRSGLRDAVLHAAANKPLFGVCVGMQMLLDHSEEGDTPGLGLVAGQVKRFQLAGQLQSDGSRFRYRKWAGIKCATPPHRAGHIPFLRVLITMLIFTLCTAFTLSLCEQKNALRVRTMVSGFAPLWHGIICLRPNFILKKVLNKA